jgi:hypothetical protein
MRAITDDEAELGPHYLAVIFESLWDDRVCMRPHRSFARPANGYPPLRSKCFGSAWTFSCPGNDSGRRCLTDLLLLEQRGVAFELGAPGLDRWGLRGLWRAERGGSCSSQRGARGCCPRYDSASIHPRRRRPRSLGSRPRLSCRKSQETNPPDIITML